jgi:2-polyprenyl-3-methyl-5-hydroxy-6-metoxy-1,4-benzoquinol methylase
MPALELLTTCPICDCPDQRTFITCQDFTVSQEKFNIVSCQCCSFKFTNPRPTAAEIGRYYQSDQYVSHHTEAKGLIYNIYNQVRKYTLKKKLSLLNKLEPQKGHILDVGCGVGLFLQTCKEGGWQIDGMEPDVDARSIAEKNTGIRLRTQIDDTLPQNKYDVITLWHVLEHIHDLQSTIKTLVAALKPTGKLIIAVPNHESHDAQHYGEYWAAYDVPRHLYHFSQDSITHLMKTHRMQVNKTLPMLFDSTYVSMLSSKYRSGKTQYLFAILEGLNSNLWASNNKKNYSSLIYICQKQL